MIFGRRKPVPEKEKQQTRSDQVAIDNILARLDSVVDRLEGVYGRIEPTLDEATEEPDESDVQSGEVIKGVNHGPSHEDDQEGSP